MRFAKLIIVIYFKFNSEIADEPIKRFVVNDW